MPLHAHRRSAPHVRRRDRRRSASSSAPRELMKQDPNGDVRAHGGVDLPTIQKYLNLWYSLSLDLFGGEISSNAADFFAAGLKGRYKEDTLRRAQALDRLALRDGRPRGRQGRPQGRRRCATRMNEVLRDEYVEDCQRGVDAGTRRSSDEGIDVRADAAVAQVPPPDRHVVRASTSRPTARCSTTAEWDAQQGEWLPNDADEAYIKSLMKPVLRARQDGELDRAADARASTACPSTSSTSASSY